MQNTNDLIKELNDLNDTAVELMVNYENKLNELESQAQSIVANINTIANDTITLMNDSKDEVLANINNLVEQITDIKDQAVVDINRAVSDNIDTLTTIKNNAIAAIQNLANQTTTDFNNMRDELNTIKDNAIQSLNDTKQSFEDDMSTIVANVVAVKNQAISEITTAKDTGLQSLNTATTNGVNSVNSAKDNAIAEINELIRLDNGKLDKNAYNQMTLSNRAIFAGSGVIKGYVDKDDVMVGDNYFDNINGVPFNAFSGNINSMGMGNPSVPTLGSTPVTSLLNIDGNIIRYISGYANHTEIKLAPPTDENSVAEDGTHRQDLIAIEVWHENIANRDFVFPYGNVQYNFSDSIGDMTSLVPYSGSDKISYCNHTNGSENSIGKGRVWSSMSEAEKDLWTSIPENNIYSDKGEYIQVRYRVRSIRGNKYGWNSGTYNTFGDNNSNVTSRKIVKVRGSSNTIVDLGLPADNSDGFVMEGSSLSTLGVAKTDSTQSYNGEVYLYPLALVQRENVGLFHPTYNVMGRGVNVNAGFDEDFYINVSLASSESDIGTLFDPTKRVTNSGLYSSGRSVFFYRYADVITKDSIRDLRKSALKLTEDQLLREAAYDFRKEFARPVHESNDIELGVMSIIPTYDDRFLQSGEKFTAVDISVSRDNYAIELLVNKRRNDPSSIGYLDDFYQFRKITTKPSDRENDESFPFYKFHPVTESLNDSNRKHVVCACINPSSTSNGMDDIVAMTSIGSRDCSGGGGSNTQPYRASYLSFKLDNDIDSTLNGNFNKKVLLHSTNTVVSYQVEDISVLVDVNDNTSGYVYFCGTNDIEKGAGCTNTLLNGIYRNRVDSNTLPAGTDTITFTNFDPNSVRIRSVSVVHAVNKTDKIMMVTYTANLYGSYYKDRVAILKSSDGLHFTFIKDIYETDSFYGESNSELIMKMKVVAGRLFITRNPSFGIPGYTAAVSSQLINSENMENNILYRDNTLFKFDYFRYNIISFPLDKDIFNVGEKIFIERVTLPIGDKADVVTPGIYTNRNRKGYFKFSVNNKLRVFLGCYALAPNSSSLQKVTASLNGDEVTLTLPSGYYGYGSAYEAFIKVHFYAVYVGSVRYDVDTYLSSHRIKISDYLYATEDKETIKRLDYKNVIKIQSDPHEDMSVAVTTKEDSLIKHSEITADRALSGIKYLPILTKDRGVQIAFESLDKDGKASEPDFIGAIPYPTNKRSALYDWGSFKTEPMNYTMASGVIYTGSEYVMYRFDGDSNLFKFTSSDGINWNGDIEKCYIDPNINIYIDHFSAKFIYDDNNNKVIMFYINSDTNKINSIESTDLYYFDSQNSYGDNIDGTGSKAFDAWIQPGGNPSYIYLYTFSKDDNYTNVVRYQLVDQSYGTALSSSNITFDLPAYLTKNIKNVSVINGNVIVAIVSDGVYNYLMVTRAIVTNNSLYVLNFIQFLESGVNLEKIYFINSLEKDDDITLYLTGNYESYGDIISTDKKLSSVDGAFKNNVIKLSNEKSATKNIFNLPTKYYY